MAKKPVPVISRSIFRRILSLFPSVRLEEDGNRVVVKDRNRTVASLAGPLVGKAYAAGGKGR